MKRNEMFPSKYLKSDDVESGADNNGNVHAVIKAVKQEILKDNEGNEEEKSILYFRNQEKGLVLNKTNADRLFDLWEESDDWVGKSILLYTETITAFGKTAPAIRIRIPKNANSGNVAKAQQSRADEPPLTEPEGAPFKEMII